MNLEDTVRALIREEVQRVLREELPRALASARFAANDSTECLVGVQEAAQRLGLSVSTVYKRAECCELPSVKDGGRLLFKVDDLAAYANERRRSPGRVQRLANRLHIEDNVIQNGEDDQRP